MTLQQLEQEFADIRKLGKEAGDRVREAYQLARLYVRFLIQSFTLAAPRQILHGLKGKQPIDGLLTSVTKMTVPQFETRFRNRVAEMNN